MNDSTLHRPRYGSVDKDYALRMASTPVAEDDQIWMVNLMKYRTVANYADGRESSISGRQADDLYAPLDVLANVGAEVVFVGDLEAQLLGDSPVWERIAVVKYPTRRAFIEMNSRPDFRKKHLHKEAGMEATIVIGCHPFELPNAVSKDLDGVPDLPTEGDGPITFVEVLRFADGDDPYFGGYSPVACRAATSQGVRLNSWFSVEGTIIGDGRVWDQVRFSSFTSRAVFRAAIGDLDRLEAQNGFSRGVLLDGYSMVVVPTHDVLAASI